MTGKADFTLEEWSRLLAAPMLAGVAVTLAEPSGLFGMLREGMASGAALIEVRNDANADALAKAVVADLETSEGRSAARGFIETQMSGKPPTAVKEMAIATLAEVGALLDAKAPADAAPFKEWLRHIADAVAQAASEGGFLGFGGVKVTDAEKATIAEIAAALKLPA